MAESLGRNDVDEVTTAYAWGVWPGVILAVIYLFALIATDGMGFTRDESYYFHAGRDYAGWFTELEANLEADNLAASFTQEGIDRHWSYNPEHPVLLKTLFGLSDKYFHAKRGWMSPSLAMRFPTMLAAMLMVFLTYLFARDAFRSQLAGVAAGLSIALLPRLFFHGHLACFDVAITTAWLATVYAYWRALRSLPWTLHAGIIWGIALITKLNAFFIPIGLLVHWFFSQLSRWDFRRESIRIPALPLALFSMAIIGPIIFYAGWPRHWFDTVERVNWYLNFHLTHEHYFVNYFGQNLWEPPFPWHYPFGMTLTTTPIVMLALWFVGGGTMLGDAISRLRSSGRFFADERATGLLLAINVLLPFLIIARPSTPIFGGIKHWFPALPFLAIMGGYAVKRAADILREQRPGFAPIGIGALFLAITIPTVLQTWQSRNVGTGYYNEAVGGYTGGADHKGMRQFWGYAARLVIPWLNEHVPEGGSVNFQNTTRGAYNMYIEEGILRSDIRSNYNSRTADCFVFHEQKAFAESEYDTWSVFETMSPSYVATMNGVPMATVYCKEPVREQAAGGIGSSTGELIDDESPE